jgi:SAM-dependent methyltransferase
MFPTPKPPELPEALPSQQRPAQGAQSEAKAPGRESSPSDLARWLTAITQAWTAHAPHGKVVLSKCRGSEAGLERLSLHPIRLRGETVIQCLWRHSTRDITRNIPVPEALRLLDEHFPRVFQHGHALELSEPMQIMASKKGKVTLRIERAHALHGAAPSALALEAEATNTHNRRKHRVIDVQAPFLQALGVTDAQQRVIPAMARKWKQINKFIEVYRHAHARAGFAVPAEGDQGRVTVVADPCDGNSVAQAVAPGLDAALPFTVLDFGCGKGYLTFALAQYLQDLGLKTDVCGVELRAELVQECSRVAQACVPNGLRFVQGDVRSVAPPRMEVMVALHACDIATDHAIHTGIQAGARVILCSPCCHKELRPQLLSPHPMAPVLQHGIHLGQQAEMLTDALRALWLEAMGYEAQVFEFVALEHTSKNKMILGVRRQEGVAAAAARREKVLGQIRDLKQHYGLRHHTLEGLLQASMQTPGFP